MWTEKTRNKVIWSDDKGNIIEVNKYNSMQLWNKLGFRVMKYTRATLRGTEYYFRYDRTYYTGNCQDIPNTVEWKKKVWKKRELIDIPEEQECELCDVLLPTDILINGYCSQCANHLGMLD